MSQMVIVQWFVISTLAVLFSKCSAKEKIAQWLFVQFFAFCLVVLFVVGHFLYVWFFANL